MQIALQASPLGTKMHVGTASKSGIRALQLNVEWGGEIWRYRRRYIFARASALSKSPSIGSGLAKAWWVIHYWRGNFYILSSSKAIWRRIPACKRIIKKMRQALVGVAEPIYRNRSERKPKYDAAQHIFVTRRRRQKLERRPNHRRLFRRASACALIYASSSSLPAIEKSVLKR